MLLSVRHHHACSTYTLGFKSTFAGVLPPISSSGSPVPTLSVSVHGGGKMSQHNPWNSLSSSLSHILSIIVSPSLSHWPMQISAMHLAFNNTWMRKSLKSEKDVHVKMNYSSLVIIRECHKRRNVPKRVLQNSNSGNCVLSKTLRHFSSPFIYSNNIYQVLLCPALC